MDIRFEGAFAQVVEDNPPQDRGSSQRIQAGSEQSRSCVHLFVHAGVHPVRCRQEAADSPQYAYQVLYWAVSNAAGNCLTYLQVSGVGMIDLIIYGKPVGKARPRFSRKKNGGVTTFTPYETKLYEQGVKTLAQVAMFGKEMIDGPVKVTIKAYFQHNKKTGWHISRPDLDNIVKAILDGLNGVVFKDDAAVCQLIATKEYGEERVEVQVDHV
jgi:Holliday junction resolvase RusA-like endonuclease